MKAAYILLAILWGVYFSFHSLLARQWVKRRVYSFISARFYRLVYNILALAGLGALLYYTIFLLDEPWFPPLAEVRFLALLLAASGVFIIWACFRQYSWRQFAGLENEEGTDDLETRGLLKFVRHPMYAGSLLVLLGFWLYVPSGASFIVGLVSTLYIFVGIQLEERSLIERYGTAYIAYKKRVPMLLPFLKRKRDNRF